MKALHPLAIAAGLAAFVALLTSLLPQISRPAFSSYVVAVLLVTAGYDYTRGRGLHRYF